MPVVSVGVEIIKVDLTDVNSVMAVSSGVETLVIVSIGVDCVPVVSA